MKVTIRERKFSLRSEYDIETPEEHYHAQRKLLSLLPRVRVFADADRLVARISRRWSVFRARYDFTMSDGRTYRFWRQKFWKDVFACEGGQEKFQMYKHKGLNYSVFKNGVQIAAFTKNRFVVGRGNEYEVRINADADVLVVICMVLTLNTEEDDDDHETVMVDLGNIGPEERPFDRSWEPH